MSEQDRLDFLSAFGEEYCMGLAPTVGWDNIVRQDAFEVFMSVFRQEPGPELLSSLSTAELERFRVGSERYFECEAMSVDRLRIVIARTLARHPADTL